jgi:hypothetical protein
VRLTVVDKNSKDAFLKKLQLCMKTYDYKDETKDVRGKVIIHSDYSIHLISHH